MKLIWVHGPPAAGKLTVSKELQKMYGFKLFHNHLAVDLSLSIYDEFGEKDFYDFTNSIRRAVISKANSIGVACMVMTYMTCAEDDDREIQKYLNFFCEESIDIYPIHLCPSNDVLLNRVISEERKNNYKISSKAQLEAMLLTYKFKPIRHKNLLSIDNSTLSAREAATCIANHLSINIQEWI